MPAAHRSQPRPRSAFMLALLATTAAASLLGGCGLTDRPIFGGSSTSLASTEMDGASAMAATSKWAQAYAKNPNDPKTALGYGRTLKAIGSKDKAMEVMTAGYRVNPNDGELAAELGRLALDSGRLDIAKHALKSAEAHGVEDWRTLSAQGTLRAKEGDHAQAQQFFLAALQVQPDAVPVINNLALSYALDGKADKAEDLLRKATASGHEDKRVRQNLALVLGLQGKFGEARQVASTDMKDTDAKASMAYLQNMLDKPTRMAAVPADESEDTGSGDEWAPFAATDQAPSEPARKTAAATPTPAPIRQVAATPAPSAESIPTAAAPARVQVVKPTEDLVTPNVPGSTKAPVPTQQKRADPAKAVKEGQTAAPKSVASASTAVSLLRADVD